MRFALGFVSAVALLVAFALLLILTGAYNLAASEPHLPAVRWALETAMQNGVERSAQAITAPTDFTDEQVRHGFQAFDAMCVQCHGAPGQKRADWTAGMRPRPPDLSEKVAGWTPAEVFWILRHGIKMTGMPAFGKTHKDETLWNIVAFVQRLPATTPDDYVRLRKELASAEHGQHHRR